MIKLEEPETPAFLKMGLFGNTKSGKTFTAAKVLSQFIRDYCPEKQLSMFDTEPSAGYIKDMVKQITGKPLLAIHSRSFSDLVEYANLCKEKGYVAWCDSITHRRRRTDGGRSEATIGDCGRDCKIIGQGCCYIPCLLANAINISRKGERRANVSSRNR